MRPSVSVLMPCYNARESIPWALGSVLTQTFDDWELVLIDDGSTDHPEEIVEQANDPRVRLIPLPENRGRGHARQAALDNARGEFVAMLDADDWMYPNRLAPQVDALRHEPSVALVSAGMAIVNRANDLVGVRMTGEGSIQGPFREVVCPVAHAPSMYRRSLVGDRAFDPTMRMGEDQDFLLRLLLHRRYMVLPEVMYVYAELGSVSAAKAAGAQRYARRRLRKHLQANPRQAIVATACTYGKQGAYLIAAALRLDDRVIRSRSRPATRLEHDQFERARARVKAEVMARFDSGHELSP